MTTTRSLVTEVRKTDRLRKILRRRGIRRAWKAMVAAIFVSIAVAIPLLVVPRTVRWWQARRDAAEVAARGPTPPPAVLFPDLAGRPLTIPSNRWDEIGLRLTAITTSPSPPGLKMDGVLYLDPDDYSLVRSRFLGEVVEMPMLPALAVAGSPPERSLRFGDTVKKGELLAVVWSRELGEKKSELAQALSSLAFDRETLARLSDNRAAVPINSIREVERRVRENEIAVERIEKTLRSWQLTAIEIQQIRSELLNEETLHPDGMREIAKGSVDRWARVEVRSPIDGTIVEKNITVGTLVDLDDALFKVANLRHLDVRAFAYEEDLVTLQRLTTEQRQWTVRLKGDSQSKPIQGVFDRIGSLIDPLQHTGLVMGWVDNADGSLRAGQFVTASVTMPDPQPLVSVPAEAVVDVDGTTLVLLQQDNLDLFLPIQVRVVRFQDDLACIDPRGPANCQGCLVVGKNVATSGAVEILAEYQMHLKTVVPQTPLNQTADSSTTENNP